MNAGDHDGHEEHQQQRTQIGPVLQQKRREKGLSLKDVEQATKIRTRYLEGLEREDYSALPDAVYVQGFLKTYANFLGLDGDRLSRELKDRRAPRRERQLDSYDEGSTVSDFEQPLIAPGELGSAERRRVSRATVLIVALAVLVLAATVGGLYLIGSRAAPPGGAGEPEAQKETPAETEPAPSAEQITTEPAGEAPTTTPTAGAVRVTLRVAGGSSGLNVYTDGTLAYSQVAQSGFSRTFEARDAVTVSAANAGVITVEVDGRSPEPLGNPGQGATRTFTPQSGG